MNKECAVISVGTAVPKYECSRPDIVQVGNTWLADDPIKHELFQRFLSSSKTDRRFFAISTDEILSLNGLHGRLAHFEREGPILGESAVRSALDQSFLSPDNIDTLLFTSCSCPPIPSIDALVLERIGMARTTNRIPIYQHGCAGGVVGLGIASRLARAGQTVALSAVELCSLVFHSKNPTPAELVGSAIFADGSACAVIAPSEHGLIINDHESFLIPETRHLMGYNLEDDGFHLRLDRDLPSVLTDYAPQRVQSFLAKHGLNSDQVKHWLFHPGGIKILNYLEEAFSLKPEQATWSREVLHEYGNISSATVLFVLDKFLQSNIIKDGDRAIMLGIGPGLTIELILFEYRA